MVDVEGGMWEGEMLDVGFGMLDVGFEMLEGGIWNGACGTGMFSHRSQIDFFACGEPFYMGAFNGHVPKGQKFIAQGKRSGALGIMCCVACVLPQGQKY